LVNVECRFLSPTRFGDDITIDTEIAAVRRSSFDLRHRVSRDGAVAVEAFETRVWVRGDPNDGAMKSSPLPPAVIERLSQLG
jgi:4-hydroxybenzoyl-CoA thioesterase